MSASRRILIYSQTASMGGSTRLLLNLARSLASEHRVSVAFGGTHTPDATRTLMAEFKDLELVPGSADYINGQSFELAVMHLPFSLDEAFTFKVPVRMGVIMELVERHDITIRQQHSKLFQRILYLHPEQVQHLDRHTVQRMCLLLPIINNIDFEPEFVKTRCVGCIGGAHKNRLAYALKLLDVLPPDYRLRIWSADKLSLQNLPMETTRQAIAYLGQDRLQVLPATGNIRKLNQSYDVLLHTPEQGNGTSVVVSDALNCGKWVFLNPLPEYRKAYSALPGVAFTDRTAQELADLTSDYSIGKFREISEGYQNHYVRDAAIAKWQQAILQ